MAYPTVTAFNALTPPTRDDPLNFDARADATFAALPALQTQMNTAGNWMSNTAGQVATDAGAAAAALTAATSAKNAAELSAQTAASAAGASKWVAGTYAEGVVVYSPTDFQSYRRKVAGVSATDPAATPADWENITPRPAVKLSTTGAGVTLARADLGKLIDATATLTLSFATCSSLGDGWHCYIRNNSSSSDVTLLPNFPNMIDALSSFVMYPGEVRLVQCDGTTLRSIVIAPFAKTFTAAATFIKPPGYRHFGGIAWSGGTSGARGDAGIGPWYGGPSGGAWPFTIPSNAMTSTVPVLIGDGGAANTSTVSSTGNPGSDTSFGSFFTVKGASASDGGAIAMPNGNALLSNTGTAAGFEGWSGNSSAATLWGGTKFAGSSLWGGGAGATISYPSGVRTVTSPGTSKMAGNGGAAGATEGANGSPGVAPGGGGGAANAGGSSGAGARGELRIWGIA